MGSKHDLWDLARPHAESLVAMKARQLVGRAGFTRADVEDIQQHLHFTLIGKLDLFDPTRGRIEAFATAVVQSEARVLLRDRRRLKRGGGKVALPLEGEELLAKAARIVPPERAAGEAEFRAAISTLPEHLRETAMLLMSKSVSAIARETGRDPRHVRNDLAEIRQHLERRGIGADFFDSCSTRD